MEAQRVNILLLDKHRAIIEDYGKRHGMIAKTGRKTGSVNTSAVIQFAIEMLPAWEQLQQVTRP